MIDNFEESTKVASDSEINVRAIEEVRGSLEFIAKKLVDHPDNCIVKATKAHQVVVFQLSCKEGETGKLVGKAGKMAASLRLFLTSIASKNKIRAILEIVD